MELASDLPYFNKTLGGANKRRSGRVRQQRVWKHDGVLPVRDGHGLWKRQTQGVLNNFHDLDEHLSKAKLSRRNLSNYSMRTCYLHTRGNSIPTNRIKFQENNIRSVSPRMLLEQVDWIELPD